MSRFWRWQNSHFTLTMSIKLQAIPAKVFQLRFYLPTLSEDAHNLVKGCDRCHRSENVWRRHEMPLNNGPWLNSFYIRSIDSMGPFLSSFFNQLIYTCGSQLCIKMSRGSVWTNEQWWWLSLKRTFLQDLKPLAIISYRNKHFCNKNLNHVWLNMVSKITSWLLIILKLVGKLKSPTEIWQRFLN